jgi:WD40 repeat protein
MSFIQDWRKKKSAGAVQRRLSLSSSEPNAVAGNARGHSGEGQPGQQEEDARIMQRSNVSTFGPVSRVCGSLVMGLAVLGCSWVGAAPQVPAVPKEKAVRAESKQAPGQSDKAPSKAPMALLLKGHSDWVQGLSYRADGKWLASVGRDRTLRIWDTSSGQMIRLWPLATKDKAKEVPPFGPRAVPAPPRAVAFSPDGRWLAAATGRWQTAQKEWEGEILLWDLTHADREPVILQGHKAEITCLAFRADGQLLASGSADRTVLLWELPAGRQRSALAGHEGTIWGIAFSPDGQRLASASADSTVKVWEVASGREWTASKGPLTLEGLGPAFPAAKSEKSPGQAPPRKETEKGKKEEKKEVGKEKKAEGQELRDMTSVAFSPDGRLLAAGNLNGVGFLWEAASGKLQRRLPAGEGLWCLSFHPGGHYLALGGWNGLLQVWDLARGQVVWQERLPGVTLTAVAFSPDGRQIAAGSTDGLVRLWQARIGPAAVP